MYLRSGFCSGGTCERTLVPVFVPGEHPNVPSFRFSPGEHPPKPPFWKPPFCQPHSFGRWTTTETCKNWPWTSPKLHFSEVGIWKAWSSYLRIGNSVGEQGRGNQPPPLSTIQTRIGDTEKFSIDPGRHTNLQNLAEFSSKGKPMRNFSIDPTSSIWTSVADAIFVDAVSETPNWSPENCDPGCHSSECPKSAFWVLFGTFWAKKKAKSTQKALFGALRGRCPKALKHSVGHSPARGPWALP